MTWFVLEGTTAFYQNYATSSIFFVPTRDARSAQDEDIRWIQQSSTIVDANFVWLFKTTLITADRATLTLPRAVC